MSVRGKTRLVIISVLALAILAAFFDLPVPASWPFSNILNAIPYKLGLDLQGGAHLVYQADVSAQASADKGAAVSGVRDVIERRVNALGISEPIVQTNQTVGGDYRVIVELAGVFDVNEAIRQIGETPLLEFRELAQTTTSTGPVVLDEEQLAANEAVRTQAQELLDRALQDEDFADLARQYSEDPGSSQKGGDLGFVKSGAFVPEFEQALFDPAFKNGEVWPELVGTQFGWHVIKKESERGAGVDFEVQARHILLAVEQAAAGGDNFVNTKLSGQQLNRAELVFDPGTNAPQVSLVFDDEGAELFQEITARNIGQPVAIYLDGAPISVPVVQQEITGGEAVISGQFSIPEAKILAQRLNAGALPVPIELVSQQTVGPSLGKASVAASVKAGILGLILIAVFMMVYYRLPGVLAVLALMVYAALVLAIFKLLGITLTLAGIAGFILSLGMAVDANVLIFERMKEELRARRPLREAVELGASRAWSSIRDSNVSTLLTTLALYWFGTSLIRGFAITLSIGVLLSMFTAIVFTRALLRLFPDNEKLGWWFGVAEKY